MTNNKQQTAVEQFLNAIKDQILLSKEHLEMIESYAEQAKEMETEQHANTWNNAISAVAMEKWESFEQFYNKTYGGNK